MTSQKSKYLIIFPILFALSLILFSGTPTDIQASGGDCYQVFLPLVIGSGGGQAAPTNANLCDGPGSAEVLADFNGDGYADLAIGSPNESVFFNGSDVQEAGAVNVIYGSPGGLSTTNNQIWSRASTDVARDPEPFNHFGQALTVGDFDGDGYDDLAIGVPDSFAWPPDQTKAGVVQLLYGSAAGLTPDVNWVWAQSTTNIPGDPETNDHFGAALTSGDYNNDSYDDLAVGVPGENVAGITNAGAVNIIYGSANGLTFTNPIPHLVTQDLVGSSDPAEMNDYFGSTLATGDFNSDGLDDLAVGIPDEDIPTPGGNLTDAGAIQIFHGQGFGLVDTFTNSADSHFWYADSNPYVAGALEEYDRFGGSLAAGDFNNDSYDDLGVGIPSETHGSGSGAILFAGAINVFYGSITGIDATAAWPAQIWHQDSPGIPDNPQFAERFGYSLAAADFNNDGYEDLAIGIPYEESNPGINIGAVNVLYGSGVGITAANNDFLIQGPLLTEDNDQWGYALTADDFDGDGFVDLAIGAPNDTPDVVLNTGSVTVRYSDSSGVPGDFGQQIWHQGSPGIIGTPETGEEFGASIQ